MSSSQSRAPASRAPADRFELFASTAPGLESITAGELKTLGIRGRQETGGVAFAGDLDRIYHSNLWLRTASRVVVRLGRFHASTFYELERRAKKLRWADYLPQSGRVAVRITCRKSRLYHSAAVAERVLGVIARVAPHGVNLQIAGPSDEGAGHDDGADERADETGKAVPNGGATEGSQSFLVRIVNDECEISADTSGELLHRRGYRQEVAKAPLRETLAAAMLLASGWQSKQPLLDPMCGSGTIPIEAALIASRAAPGLGRSFQFMEWPSFDRKQWDEILSSAKSAMIKTAVDIRGADRDEGAIQAARRNAERAGVVAAIQFSAETVSASFQGIEDVAEGEGWIITNPPYGIRVGESTDLRNLYATLGTVVKRKTAWRIGVLAADESLARQMRIPMRSRFQSRNGGIPVRFLVSEKSAELASVR
jgi:putative N6-adenine-specific DNA methylase